MANVELSYMFDKDEASSADIAHLVHESEEFTRSIAPAGADMHVCYEPAGHEEDAFHFLDISGIVYGAYTYKEVSDRLGSLQRMLHERFNSQQRVRMEKAVAAVAISGAANNLRASSANAKE